MRSAGPPGTIVGARQAFETACAADDPEFTPKAAVNLGVMYMDEERVSEAYGLFETASAAPDPAVSLLGHCYLGVLLANGTPAVAEQHLRTALETGNPEVREMAAGVLEMMRSQ